MLVVSRKQHQSVLFPALGIRVKILRVAGKAVRVGVDAPRDVLVLRSELTDDDDSSPGLSDGVAEDKHAMRNRLNKANLAMKLLKKQLEAGKVAAAEDSLRIALEAFNELDQLMSEPGSRVPAPIAPQSHHEQSPPEPDKPKKLALLVEDDPNERTLLAAYLRASGYEVDTAEDGQAALDYLAVNKPDAVIMDMQMPRLNGRQCVQEIRSDYHFDDMQLFVVSGMEQKAMQVPSGDRGVQRWFQKPLSPEDLVQALDSSLNN